MPRPRPPSMPLLTIDRLSKTYDNGFVALDEVSLDVERGEILALLGPNGAGKTTLIGIVCGIVNASSGRVSVDGHDIVRDYRKTRSMIGLVPQELTTDSFESVWNTVSFSRGLFGRAPDPAHIERVLRQLSLWDKKDNRLMTLSGGMKRRVLIAKALSHEPSVLFLDEPSAGVDVELRKDMWAVVRALRDAGTTIILTTHYIEEAEEMADRVAVINHGRILLVEEKLALMRRLGRKQLTVELAAPLAALPAQLAGHSLRLADEGMRLVYDYDPKRDENAIPVLLAALGEAGIAFRDLHTDQSSLEDIFVGLVAETRTGAS
ncbi:MAG: ABC transporter ATP-binding protein [Burkholderiaceae bacterium]|nr:ABC transporter ATP-binding protein [Burkholderiaceae bacterium]